MNLVDELDTLLAAVIRLEQTDWSAMEGRRVLEAFHLLCKAERQLSDLQAAWREAAHCQGPAERLGP